MVIEMSQIPNDESRDDQASDLLANGSLTMKMNFGNNFQELFFFFSVLSIYCVVEIMGQIEMGFDQTGNKKKYLPSQFLIFFHESD